MLRIWQAREREREREGTRRERKEADTVEERQMIPLPCSKFHAPCSTLVPPVPRPCLSFTFAAVFPSYGLIPSRNASVACSKFRCSFCTNWKAVGGSWEATDGGVCSCSGRGGGRWETLTRSCLLLLQNWEAERGGENAKDVSLFFPLSILPCLFEEKRDRGITERF